MVKGLRVVVALLVLYVGFSIYRFDFEKTKLKTSEFVNKVDMVLIEKSARKMSLLSGRKTVAQYDIDLGFNPTGHKEQEGDGRTPEGFYKISGRNPKSKYFLSLKISKHFVALKINCHVSFKKSATLSSLLGKL